MTVRARRGDAFPRHRRSPGDLAGRPPQRKRREGNAMTIRSILALLTGTDSDGAVLEAALAIARRSAAHIDAAHVRSLPGEVLAYGAPEAMAGAEEVIAAMEQEARRREEAARACFERWRSANDVSAG